MHTTADIANSTGRAVRTVRATIVRLGIPKAGRDYYLTDQQAEQVRHEMHDGPGRPRK